ncbi:FMN-binding negative transcriptional regulator [Ferruginibacter sp.]|nr:hypothetical protein [Ferruginibacter sp.]
MKQFSVVPIIAAKDNIPEAKHLPFFVTKIDDVILTAHFAKANEYWNYIEDSEVLVIFYRTSRLRFN